MEKEMDDYDYAIVASETAECQCGATHEEGDRLWGSVYPLDEFDTIDPMGRVKEFHDVSVEPSE